MSYEQQAATMVTSVKSIFDSVRTTGLGTMTIMTVLRELMAMTELVSFIRELSTDDRELFLTEVFDQAIGTEQHALITQLGPIGGEGLEKFSDGLKEVFIAFIDKDERLAIEAA